MASYVYYLIRCLLFYGITRYMLFRGKCLSVNLAAFSHFLFINFNLVPSSKPQSFNCNVYFWLELYNWLLLDYSYIVDKRGIFKFMVKKLTSFLRLTFPQQTSVYQRVHCMVFCKCHLKWTNYIFTVKLLKLGKENQSFKEEDQKGFHFHWKCFHKYIIDDTEVIGQGRMAKLFSSVPRTNFAWGGNLLKLYLRHPLCFHQQTNHNRR